jgi:lincosamide nucleotidyltransferase B/F
MLIQESMIERVRQICEQDEQVIGAVMYGSFALGEGDRFSDIEFVLFFNDDAFIALDREAWVSRIAPLELFFRDDFGHYTAIFDNLVRGEFHFERESAMNIIDSWRGSVLFTSLKSCIIIDRSEELARHLRPLLLPPGDPGANGRARSIQMMLANLILFGSNVLDRGEVARALEILNLAHRYLLWLARLAEGSTAHWPTPSRGIEHDISPAAYARYVKCTAPANVTALRLAYRSVWEWGQELFAALVPAYGPAVTPRLAGKINARLMTD